MEKMCQSCAMLLMPKGQDLRGSNDKGGKSDEYCYLCYVNGKFLSPDITTEVDYYSSSEFEVHHNLIPDQSHQD
ncbi:zinc ribbon domain-containing protein [Streptococcus parauberis]|uniref:zinc ribbon domain-containing protein n=1 Tax=Streptococcus parauberis TaxID=1348 RepID=UPI0037B26C50